MFRGELFMPSLFRRLSVDAWQEQGSPDAAAVAREKARYLLADHEPEPLDPTVRAELGRIAASLA